MQGWFMTPFITLTTLLFATVMYSAQTAASAPASSRRTIKLQNGDSLTYTTREEETLLTFKGVNESLEEPALKRDKDVAPQSRVKHMKVVGEIGRNVLILTDTYYSLPGSMQFCQAGDETFLRVVALKPEPKVTFEKKLESCRSNLELAEPGLAWNPETFTLQIHWLQNPAAKGEANSQSYKIDAKGQVVPLHSE